MYKEMNLASQLAQEVSRVTECAKILTRCKRKGVGSSIVSIYDGQFRPIFESFNGPTRVNFQCTNIVGACGCIHAEPRAISIALKHGYKGGLILCNTYSPCVTCANLIIESGLFIGVVREIFTEYPKTGLAHHDERGEEFIRTSGIDVLAVEEIQLFLKEKKEGKVLDTVRQWKCARPIGA
jgi:deoxycytidylate deaminase